MSPVTGTQCVQGWRQVRRPHGQGRRHPPGRDARAGRSGHKACRACRSKSGCQRACHMSSWQVRSIANSSAPSVASTVRSSACSIASQDSVGTTQGSQASGIRFEHAAGLEQHGQFAHVYAGDEDSLTWHNIDEVFSFKALKRFANWCASNTQLFSKIVLAQHIAGGETPGARSSNEARYTPPH